MEPTSLPRLHLSIARGVGDCHGLSGRARPSSWRPVVAAVAGVHHVKESERGDAVKKASMVEASLVPYRDQNYF